MKQPTRSAKTVTQQELCQPVEWGQFAGVSEKVSLMSPPLHILQAVFCDPLKPTDIAYVIVVGAKQKKKKTKRPRKPVQAAPKYKLTVEGGEVPSVAPQYTLTIDEEVKLMVEGGGDLTVAHPQYTLTIDEEDEPAGVQHDKLTIDGDETQEQHPYDEDSVHDVPAPQFKLTVLQGDEEQLPSEQDSALERDAKQHLDESISTFATIDESKLDALCYDEGERDVSKTEANTEGSESSDNSVVSSLSSNETGAITLASQRDLMSRLMEEGDNSYASTLLNKLAESHRRERKLQLQLLRSGLTAITEDISYAKAKAKINEISARMNEIGGTNAAAAAQREEYFKLEQEMERYNAAIMLTDEWQYEQDASERQWEEDNVHDNLEALRQVRRHMPVLVRQKTVQELIQPVNGRVLPIDLVKRFKRTNVITLIRMNPADIERMHPSMLESMRVTGLTLTERRALYAHLQETGAKWKKMSADSMTARKYKWFTMMKSNFKEALDSYQYHVSKYGPPINHPRSSASCPTGCPLLGRCCPVVADAAVSYTGDYGYPDTAEYESSNLQTQETELDSTDDQVKEQAKLERGRSRVVAFKKHYQGKLLEISKASGSCQAMDDLMDKMEMSLKRWTGKADDESAEVTKENTVLDSVASMESNRLVAESTESLNDVKRATIGFALRAGMEVTGVMRNSDAKDPRSLVEAMLADEFYERVCEHCEFIETRTREAGICSDKDNRIFSTIKTLLSILHELHRRNVDTIQRLGVVEPIVEDTSGNHKA